MRRQFHTNTTGALGLQVFFLAAAGQYHDTHAEQAASPSQPTHLLSSKLVHAILDDMLVVKGLQALRLGLILLLIPFIACNVVLVLGTLEAKRTRLTEATESLKRMSVFEQIFNRADIGKTLGQMRHHLSGHM